MRAVSALFATAALLATSSTFAQTMAAAEPAASPLTFNISLTSNYKFRGQDQDQSKTRQFKPALQGGVDYAFDSGFYVGNWNSTINWTKYLPSGNDADVELDFYGGYKFNAGPLAMDVGALTYVYPSASGANTTELYIGAGFGPVTAKYSHTVSKGYFGIGKEVGPADDGRGTGYLNVGFSQEVLPKLTAKASVGYTNFKSSVNSAGLPNYIDYSVGAAYDLGAGFTVTGALVGGNKKSSYFYAIDPGKSINKNTLVVTLTKAL